MRKLAIFGVILGVVVLIASMLYPTVLWVGNTSVRFRFHVLESGTLRRVTEAKIRVIHTSELRDFAGTNFATVFPATMADTNGIISMLVSCGAGGSSGLFGRKGRLTLSHELFVEADGYRPLATALANVAGGRRWPISKRVFDVELLLSKNP
jgi:hypothetical protein